LENSLTQTVLDGYGEHNLLKIKNHKNYLITNSQIMNDLQKISEYIKKELVSVRHQKNDTGVGSHTETDKSHVTYKVEARDKILVSNIMSVYLDNENRAVLNCLKKPMTIQEIVKVCKTPISSTYRRISFLLEMGYLRVAGYKKELGKKSKSMKFEKTIQNIMICIEDGAVLIVLNIDEDIVRGNKFCFVIKE